MTVAELSEYIMISKKEIKKRLYVSARLFAIIGWASHPIGHVVYLPTQYKSNYGKWYDLIGNAKESVVSLQNPIKNHMMDAVKKALRQKGYK